MNPYKLKDVFKYLTSNNQLLKKKLKLGTSEMPIPPKRDDVTTIEAINRFNKANPRVDTTNLQPLSVKHSNVKKPDEPDMKANGGRIGYKDGPKLTDFLDVKASGTKSGKNQIEGAPEGITADSETINAIIKADIPVTEKINLLATYGYGKGRTRIENKDQEIFLDEGGYKDRNVGLDFNRDGEGVSGSVNYGIDTGEPQLNIRYKKSFADGGMLVQPSDDGSRPGYAGSRVSVPDIKNLFIIKHSDGKKVYEAGVASKNTELGPAMKRRFPFTEQGKKDALKAIKEHKEKYPNIGKKTVYKNQTTIQKNKDGILRYQRKNKPTKYYDPKKYGSEEKAFKAAEKDVAEAQVAKKTSKQVDVDINEIKKLRNKGLSQVKVAEKLGVGQATIKDRLVKAGESTKDLSTRDEIPKEIQKEIKTKYSQVKNWDFKKYTYGVSPSADTRIYDRIKGFVNEPKKFSIAADFSTPQGWMVAQMERSYKLGNKNYTPIKTLINNKNKIVGFIDNTEFGGGGKYIVNEKFIKGKNADGIPMSLHPDYEDTAKFVDISKKAKLPVQGVLKDLLKNEGVDTTRISLSDLFKQMKNKVGYDGVKNALEKHHISGVKNRATGNYQLLDRDLNALARVVTKEIEQGDLSRVGELKKRGVMVEVGGQTYGGGPKTPGGQLKRFEKQVTNFFQNDPNAKKIIQTIASFGGGTCSVFNGKKATLKANGGRIGLQTGTPNIDDCFKSGSAVINSGKVSVDKADDFVQLLKRTAGLGRNIMKFGIIPEAIYVAADSLLRVGMGDTFAEAGLRASDYVLPGDQTKAAEMSKVSRIFGDETGELVGRTIDYKNQLAKIQSLEDQKANFENLSDGGEFSYIGDLSSDVKNTENLLSQAKNDLDNKFKISEAEQLYAESKQDDAYDASAATSFLSNLKRKYGDSSDNFSDVETLAAPEKTQMQLNLDMLPSAQRNFMMATDDDLRNYVRAESVRSGEKLNPQLYIDEKQKLKDDFMTKGPGVYGKEQVYGTQGTFGGEPVDMTNYQPSNRFAGFKLGMASGGIASLTKTIPPESGPTPQGLPYVYNNVKKI